MARHCNSTGKLPHGEEQRVFGDAGYLGIQKRVDMAPASNWPSCSPRPPRVRTCAIDAYGSVREVIRRLAIDPGGTISARHRGGRLQPLGINVMRQ